MTMLVTGGRGFHRLQFRVPSQLEAHPEDRIVCLDKLTYAGNLKTLERAMEAANVRFVRGDIADAACVGALFEEEKPDIVVNFAAESPRGPVHRGPRGCSCAQTCWACRC